jgi:hypothetical protein
MCDYSHGPGTHESTRIAHRRECVLSYATPPPDLHIDDCATCRSGPPHGTRRVTTPSEHHRILRETIRCPVYYKNTTLGGQCGLIQAEHHKPANLTLLESYSTTAPHGLHQYRVYDRIRGIEEISQVVRTQSSSEVTARRRAALESATHHRHAEHFRRQPPPPPCRTPRTTPQPGVPIAPAPPCNLGNQRVDYSNPRA